MDLPAGPTTVDMASPGPQWRLTRRCALSPNQLLLSYAAVVVVSVVIAVGFGLSGLWIVPVHCLIQVLIAGAMYLYYSLHANDGERITFNSPDGHLSIEVVRGLSIRHYQMNLAWAHLERSGPERKRLWLCCSTLRVEVATQVPSRQRPQIERELKQALAASRAALFQRQPLASQISER